MAEAVNSVKHMENNSKYSSSSIDTNNDILSPVTVSKVHYGNL